MAIDSFANLKSAVATWLRRSDLTTVIPDFITMAEARFNRVLRTPDMEVRSRATLTGQYLALPADFLGIRSITLLSDPITVLEGMGANWVDSVNAGSQTGKPTAYTVVDDQFKFIPAPDGSYDVEIVYYARIPALSDSATTNWLLTEHPDIYLTGALVSAEAYMANDERIGVWRSQLDSALAELSSDGNARRRGAAPIRLRSAVNV